MSIIQVNAIKRYQAELQLAKESEESNTIDQNV